MVLAWGMTPVSSICVVKGYKYKCVCELFPFTDWWNPSTPGLCGVTWEHRGRLLISSLLFKCEHSLHVSLQPWSWKIQGSGTSARPHDINSRNYATSLFLLGSLFIRKRRNSTVRQTEIHIWKGSYFSDILCVWGQDLIKMVFIYYVLDAASSQPRVQCQCILSGTDRDARSLRHPHYAVIHNMLSRATCIYSVL